MAPIKFEENIKEKLENRTINPSANAWETLSKNLENTPQTQSKNKFWWLTIAASFIGMLLVYNIMFNNTSQTIPNQNVVEINTEYLKEINNANNTIEKATKVEPRAAQVNTQNQTVTTGKQLKSVQTQNNNSKEKAKKYNTTLVKTETKTNKIKTVTSIAGSGLKVNKATINIETVAQTQTVEKPVVLDDEIEQLLKAAQSKVSKTATQTTVVLDHNSILNEVEDDLERTFRDKILTVVKDGFYSAKDVMAERITNTQEQ